jgi:hypothetical protein
MDDFVGKIFELPTLNPPYADFGFKLFGLKLETNVWMPRGKYSCAVMTLGCRIFFIKFISESNYLTMLHGLIISIKFLNLYLMYHYYYLGSFDTH